VVVLNDRLWRICNKSIRRWRLSAGVSRNINRWRRRNKKAQKLRQIIHILFWNRKQSSHYVV